MKQTREELHNQVVALLSASRELSPAEDEVLAETFVSRLAQVPGDERRRAHPAPYVYASVTALAILLTIPVVMVIQTYSRLDGYLPPADAGALPLIYWLALAGVVLFLGVTLLKERMRWRIQISPREGLPR